MARWSSTNYIEEMGDDGSPLASDIHSKDNHSKRAGKDRSGLYRDVRYRSFSTVHQLKLIGTWPGEYDQYPS